jgi:phosphatidate cytidylyltransferase
MAIFNPASDPMFAQTLYTFGGVLTAGIAGVTAVERGRLERVARSVLFERWRTWAVIAPLFAMAVLAGPYALAALAVVAAVIAAIEYGRLMRLARIERVVLVGAGVLVPAAGLHSAEAAISALAAMALLQMMAGAGQRHARPGAVLGLVYVPLLLASAVVLHAHVDGGAGLLLAAGVATALSDVGAFAVGKLLGGPKLAPRISPNKTWAGALGNVLGAGAGIALMWFAIADMPLPALLAMPVVVAAAAVAGDLFESLLKRSRGVKDAGDWLPGFGGILDRIDSLLFVLPATLILATVAS